MINLGSYSGKHCPDVRFCPTLIDRLLEGVALSLVLLARVLAMYYVWGELLFFVSFVLLGLALVGYYVLAFKYK